MLQGRNTAAVANEQHMLNRVRAQRNVVVKLTDQPTGGDGTESPQALRSAKSRQELNARHGAVSPHELTWPGRGAGNERDAKVARKGKGRVDHQPRTVRGDVDNRASAPRAIGTGDPSENGPLHSPL
jgi:hypothetical protein